MTEGAHVTGRPIHFAGAELGEYRHVCAFFHNAEEEDLLLQPFIREGLQRGEKAYHIINPEQRTEYLDRLRTGGIEPEGFLERGQLEIRGWDEAYLREGHFDQDSMLTLIQDVLDGGQEEGYPLTRLLAHMEWSLADRPGVDDLIEYEARLNYVLPRYKDPVI